MSLAEPPESSAGPLSLEELESRITELAAHINAATYRWLCLLREFDERHGWVGWGIHSCAHWLNWKCGVGIGTAREKLRAAHALKLLPKVSAAFERGEIGYSKVRALTRIADAGNEECLLSVSLGGTASHVETLVRAYRRCKRVDELERAERQHRDRHLRCYHDEDGSLVIEARLPPEQGALVLKALEAAMDEGRMSGFSRDSESATAVDKIPAETLSTGTALPAEPFETFGARRADALAKVAETYLATGAMELNGGERYEILVHVEKHVLEGGGEGRCELEHGPWIAAETARRLACDASVVQIVDDANGGPLNVGRKTRSIPPAIRRALRSRDQGCRFPGCTRKRFVDGHHVRHWAHGGETSLQNLVSLCQRHHRLVHDGGFGVTRLDDGAFAFTGPQGRTIPAWVALPAVDPLHGIERLNQAAGLQVNADTCIPGWLGEKMDLHDAVMCLYQCEERKIESDTTEAPRPS